MLEPTKQEWSDKVKPEGPEFLGFCSLPDCRNEIYKGTEYTYWDNTGELCCEGCSNG